MKEMLMSKKIALLAALAMIPAAAHADVNVRGAGEVLTGDCRGGTATIESTGSQVTITGNCRAVTIVGDGNMITVAIADGATISVNGTGNMVNWSGAARTAPRPAVRGIGNVVQRAPS
jgi:hypothetical protein